MTNAKAVGLTDDLDIELTLTPNATFAGTNIKAEAKLSDGTYLLPLYKIQLLVEGDSWAIFQGSNGPTITLPTNPLGRIDATLTAASATSGNVKATVVEAPDGQTLTQPYKRQPFEFIEKMPVYNINWTAASTDSFDTGGWQPSNPLLSVSSIAGPALVNFQGKLWCVYSDGTYARQMWSTSFDPNSGWQGKYQVNNNSTPSMPALAVSSNNRIYCVYQNTNNLVCSTSSGDGQTWDASALLPNDDQPYQAFGPAALAASDYGLFCTWLSADDQVLGVSTDDWTETGAVAESHFGTGMATLSDRLYCTYQGLAGQINVGTSINGVNWNPGLPIGFSAGEIITDCAPALCFVPGRNLLLCVYGDGSSALRYITSASGNYDDWSTPMQVAGVSRVPGTAVGLAVMNDVIYLAYCAAP